MSEELTPFAAAGATAGSEPQSPSADTAAAEIASTETPDAGAKRQKAVTSVGPDDEGAYTAIDVAAAQRTQRSENREWVQAFNNFGGFPIQYIQHMAVTGDALLSGRVTPPGETYPPPQRDTADVSAAEIQKVRRVYVPHEGFPRALDLLRGQHCLALRGKQGVGKRAAAIELALKVLGEQASIRELSPDHDLVQQIAALSAKRGICYLVDGLLASQGHALKPLAVRGIMDTLAKSDSYLVICARPDVPFPASMPIVMLQALPTPAMTLVESHLEFYGSFNAQEIEHILADEGVKEVLRTGLTPAQADLLAAQLADALSNGEPAQTALKGFAVAAEDDVKHWFDEAIDQDLKNGSWERTTFRIALAVFNGARLSAVTEAARKLQKQITPPPGEDEKRPARPPVTFEKLSDKLEAASARRIQRPYLTDYAENTLIEAVELDNPNYPAALLKYIWYDFAELRLPLLDWLGGYAVDAPQDVRVRAANALGLLAGYDFHTIQQRVFLPWARTSPEDNELRRRRYQALGNALGVVIWNDDRKDEVLGLLRDWIENGGESLRWAAARAYAQVGLRYTRTAMNQWRAILESVGKVTIRLTPSLGIVVPHYLHTSVVDAVLALFLRATELPHRLRPVYEQALEGLLAWVQADAQEPGSEHVGLPLFLALTAIRLPPDDNSGEQEDWPPAMLKIVGTQPDSTYRRILAALLRRALRSAELQQSTIAALHSWVEAANRNDWIEQTLAAVLSEWLALPGVTERERGILRLNLTRWNQHPKASLPVAGRLLTKLPL